mmetsp:Transcript_18249/g.28811  ORF Transcript_18249/g.28811 Transcript_18249/m.28811 type:complete len:291 (+) Transcript_18249:602-1474(+)
MKGAFALRQHLERRAQCRDVRALHAAPLEAHQVQAVQLAPGRLNQAVGDHIVRYHGDRADDRAAPNAHKLVDACKAANNHVILQPTMARNGRRVHHDHPVANMGIMGDMAARHKETVMADPSHAATALGAAIHRHMLANAVAFADLKTAGLTLEFKVLRHLANDSEGEHDCAGPNAGVAGDHHMAFQLDLWPDHHVGADHTERANPRRWINPRARLDHGRGVDHRSTHVLGMSIIAVNSASQAISPSTSATPENFHTLLPALPRVVVNLSSRTSPGTTIRRNLHLSMARK